MNVQRRGVLVAGASGLVGRALVDTLRSRGHQVVRLVRREARETDEARWDPAHGEISSDAMQRVSAVVNLSGENVGAGRWTKARKEAILRSRVDSTRTLVEGMRRAGGSANVLVSVSAVGVYGDRGDEVLREGADSGAGFLPEVCRAWEAEAREAERAGARVAIMRLGVVLAKEGGALAKMLPVFRAGAGGRVGSGKQWMSWVSLEDAVAGLVWAIEEGKCAGEFNLTAPRAVTNEEFTRTLGRVLRRPAVLPVPALAIRTLFGQMGEEALLASSRAVPERLLVDGFTFRHGELEDALRAVLGGEV